ncbi:DNA-binding protein WhiA [Mycoplasmopsis lipophila]|uniref:DNA-binding protein WhiA n=1 Tax=Mycoplasmopsis lipophila TaxID=2117 RepID=UPI003873A8FC
MINFTKTIKFEIIKNIKTLPQINEFLRGFVYSAGIEKNKNKIYLNIKSKEIKEYIIYFFKKINLNLERIFINHQQYLVFDKNNFNLSEKFNHWSSFFAGVFCGGGSIKNLSSTTYHLRLSSNSKEFINFIMNKLNTYNFNFKMLEHKQHYLIYISKQEQISDFLKAIEAINSFFTFEDAKIRRDLTNNVNRINNIDICNLNKIAVSTEKHLNNINLLFSNKLEYFFNEKQIFFFQQKKKYPYESLKNLSQIINNEYDIFIPKATMNSWLIKLNNLIEEYKK